MAEESQGRALLKLEKFENSNSQELQVNTEVQYKLTAQL